MTTILDLIERIPSVCETILKEYPTSFDAALGKLEKPISELDELIFIGSGTSDTSARTAAPLVREFSGLRTTLVWPGEMENLLTEKKEETVFGLNPKGLYIFTSQTGTSRTTARMMEKIQSLGLMTLSITENEETPLAKISRIHLSMGCGEEEFPMRTIGYVSSVLDHCLLAMAIGRKRGILSLEEDEKLRKEALAASRNRVKIQETIKDWFPKISSRLVNAQELVFTGNGTMYGISLEGAVKCWEMPQKPTFAFETEEGMHGPVFGYNGKQFLVLLTDGREPNMQLGASLVRYLSDVFQSACAVGNLGNPFSSLSEEAVCPLELAGGHFSFIEMSAVIQLIAYMLTQAIGRDVSKPIDHTEMYRYFNTHG